MKYFRVYAGYTKTRPPTKYDYIVEDDVKAKEVKEFFKSIYSWLDVYRIEEILETDVSEWALRLYKV